MRPDAPFNNTLPVAWQSLAERRVTLLLILVPMSQESGLCLEEEEGTTALLTTEMSRSIITLIMLPFSSRAP